MRKALFLLYLICLASAGQSQRTYVLGDDCEFIDSLKQLIATTSSDSSRCLNSYKIANLLLINGQKEESISYFDRANQLAVKDPYLSDMSIFFNATKHFMKRDYSGYQKQMALAYEKLKKYPVKIAYSLRAMSLQNLAILKQAEGKEEEAMRIIVAKAVPLAKQSENNELVGILYKTIGTIFMNYPDDHRANRYLALSIGYLESSDNGSPTLKESKAELYSTFAENLIMLKKMHAAGKALSKAYAILKPYPGSNLNNLYYGSECLYYYTLGNYDQASASCEKGLSSCALHQDLFAMNRLKDLKYKILLAQKRDKEAISVLLDMLHSPVAYAVDKKNWYKELADIYERKGEGKTASRYYRQHIAINDSLLQTDSQKEISRLEARFHKAENESRIRQLEAQRERMRLINENNRLYHSIAGLASLLMVVALVLFWLRANSQRKLAQEKAKNYQNSLLTLRNQKEIEIMQATISGEEVERKRIARELHDGIGSLLSSLKMKLLKNPESIQSLNTEESQQVATLLNRSIAELRQVAYNLVPETLLKLGLEKALIDLCYLLKTDRVAILLHTQGISETIEERKQMSIYRIVQELIHNALKHSACTEIIVDCSQHENLFLITVEDNGKGFDPDAPEKQQGFGLKNLRNRVASMNGKLQILSNLKEGTAFNIEIHYE